MIIVIEGPRASGKTTIAKSLAESLCTVYGTEVPIYDQYDCETGTYFDPYGWSKHKKDFLNAVAGYTDVIFVTEGLAPKVLVAQANFVIRTERSKLLWEYKDDRD